MDKENIKDINEENLNQSGISLIKQKNNISAHESIISVKNKYLLNENLNNNINNKTGNNEAPKMCMTPETILRTKYDLLTSYERIEIKDYPEIWFIGSSSIQKIDAEHKKHLEKKSIKEEKNDEIINNGYDDSRGDYHIVLHDHINYRYEVISLLGKGSFGKVLKCYDHKEKSYVAVKIIKNKKRFEKQGMIEVKVLEAIKSDDPDDKMNNYNINFIESFYFRGHLCIVNELLGINLYEWIKNGGFRGISIPMIRQITSEILCSLALLQEKKIVHCDLKPENILLRDPLQIKPINSMSGIGENGKNEKWGIKVIDFGSSCFEHERYYTYVQSRFYRSPEVILGIPYSMSIDMWSLGCILAELYTGYPIFPGENEEEQLACIMEINGVPEQYIINQGSRKKKYFDSNGVPRLYKNSKGKIRRPGSLTLSTVLRCHDASFIDFISQCLQMDPKKRMTPTQGLEHEFILKSSIASKPIATTSMFSTFDEFQNLNKEKSRSSLKQPTILATSSSSSQSQSHSSPSSTLLSNSNLKKSSSIENNSSSNNKEKMSNDNLTINTSIINGRKSSGGQVTKLMSSNKFDPHIIQARKSTGNLLSYSSSNSNSSNSNNNSNGNNSGKVAQIIAATEQKSLHLRKQSYSNSPIRYTLKPNESVKEGYSNSALATIKNVRRPSVKEMAFAKENAELALANLKKQAKVSAIKELRINNPINYTNSLPPSNSTTGSNNESEPASTNNDESLKFPKITNSTKLSSKNNSLRINISQLSSNLDNTIHSKSAYPTLISTNNSNNSNNPFSYNISSLPQQKASLLNVDTDSTLDKQNVRKLSLLSKSYNSKVFSESILKARDSISNNSNANEQQQETESNIEKSESKNKIIAEKTLNSSLKKPLVYSSLKKSTSSGNILLNGNVQSLRKTFNMGLSSTTNSNTMNKKQPTKLVPINNMNSNIVSNNSSFSSTLSSSSSTTLVNDESIDTQQQLSNITNNNASTTTTTTNPIANNNNTFNTIISSSLNTNSHVSENIISRQRAYSHSVYHSINNNAIQGSSIPRLATSIYKFNPSSTVVKSLNKANTINTASTHLGNNKCENLSSTTSTTTGNKSINSLVTRRKSTLTLKSSQSLSTQNNQPRWRV